MTSPPAPADTQAESDHGYQPGPLPVRTRRQRPGPATRDTTLMLGPLDTAPGDARATLRLALKVWGLPQLTEDVDTITSELVTNAIIASRDKAPEGTEPVAVTLRATVEGGELRIRVWDPDPTPPPGGALPGDDAENGRGLFIVNALSSRWGWYPAPNGGKFVWSALSLDTLPPDD
jgi:anti-sigma regulatory factor (Ser/Thr protein kinase)